VLVLVPFLDRGAARRGKSPLFTLAGVVGVIYIVALTSWGYRSWTPVGVVFAAGALVGVFAFAIRRGDPEPPR
jgi:quinol-cytochrome oxidoreductase complex cytochrome b subunit